MANYCWNNIEVSPSSFRDEDNKNFKKFMGKVAFLRQELGDDGDIFGYFLGNAPENVDYVSYYGCHRITNVDEFFSQIDEDNIDDTFFCSGFDTAWSPPEKFCQMLSEMYQISVKITYDESGNDFSGHAQYTNGETDYEESWSYLEGLYNMDKDWFWNEMDSQIECYIDDEVEVEEFLEGYGFLSKDDFEELKIRYTKQEKENA